MPASKILKLLAFLLGGLFAQNAVPLGRMGDIREVADLCVYLASDSASYITGQATNIGGGLLTEA